ncbi:MAG: formate/nitrite transporter family protein [Candidatus Saccharibacteria bacterium]|nr:formate/nitrite transporter family protein [Candidatus Saccharibacteria bacterium]
MKKVKKESWGEVVRESIGAAILIGMGDFVLLKIGVPIGAFLFALGLLGVCYLGQNLFTGKCGFLFSEKIPLIRLMVILVVNLVAGYLIGVAFRMADESIIEAAVAKVTSWDISPGFLLKSVFCGAIMYIAVAMYRRGTPLGIIFGVPTFILCGFQHCIANVITMGVAGSFSFTVLACMGICVVGNFVGAVGMWWVSQKK